MKIGFNATYIDPYPTGIGNFIIGTLNEFYKMYKNIKIFTGYPKFLNIDKDKIILTSKKFFPCYGRKGQFHRILWAKSVLPWLLKKYQIDLLVNLWPEGPIFPDVKMITIVHDLQPLLFPKEYRRTTYYFRYFVPMILKKSLSIIALSENTKRDIIKFYGIKPEKIKVIYQGVDLSFFKSKVKFEEIKEIKNKYGAEKYILALGDHYPRKNFVGLIYAFSKINLPHKLIIAGNPYKRFTPVIEETIKRLNCQDKVIITGYVSKETLRILYQGADLFILPSLYEGFGRPLLEAMASGTPVIASKRASIPEVAGDAALLIDPENEEEIINSIKRVLENEKLRRELIEKGGERIKFFTYKNFCKEFLNLLFELKKNCPVK